MKWAHLPVAGGIYDQHPQLIDEWEILFYVKSQVDQQEQEQQKKKAKKG